MGGTDEDISDQVPYANFIGAEYQVIGEVSAHGIYSDDLNTIAYVSLISGVGIGGRYVAFRRPVGQQLKFKVLSARQERNLFRSHVYYRVSIQDSGVYQNEMVRVVLAYGNEGEDGDLNSEIYRRLKQETR